MSNFDRFGKKKLAFALACASFFGSKTQAMNTIKNGVKSSQTLGAVGGRLLVISPNWKVLPEYFRNLKV